MQTEVLTPEQVAEYLQLSPEVVYRLIRTHQLAATRIGRIYRIPREDLDAFLIANSSRPAVRSSLFARVNAIADDNPGVDSDALLDELEQYDKVHNDRTRS